MIEWHEDVASTQTLAHARAEVGASHGTAIVARIQSEGRGTRGRAWVSGPGGLWLSVVLRPAAPAAVPLASVRIGVALARQLEPLTLGPVGLKWPNDLIAQQRKLGGILCETRWVGDRLGWMVAGVGINVPNELPAPFTDSAIRLADLGFAGGPEDLAEPVVASILAATGRDGLLDEEEMAAFASRDWLRGRDLAEPVAGRAAGITRAGHLVVERADGSRAETVGSVTLAGLAHDEARR